MNCFRVQAGMVLLSVVCGCLFAGEPVATLIGFDLMRGSQLSSFREEPRDCYELKKNTLQIKKKRFGVECMFRSRSLRPSEKNSISFQIKAAGGESAHLKAFLTFYASHASDTERCNGTTPKKKFDLSCTAEPDFQTFRFPLEINAEDLVCEQCGRTLHIGRFSLSAYLDEPDGKDSRSSGKNAGVEISPFSLTTEFPVIMGTRRQISSTMWLTDLLKPGALPAAGAPAQPKPRALSGKVAGIMPDAEQVREELMAFQPVLDLLDRGDDSAAVAKVKQIAEKNHFAMVYLYLLCSRGYSGVPIDYSQAARYFSNFIGSFQGERTPGFMFYLYEYNNIWKKYRLPPNVPGEHVQILAWGREMSTMPEDIPLRGTRPLKECYEEKMRNIGGVAARVLYLIGREQAEPVRSELMKMARERECAEAWAEPFTPYEDRSSNDVWDLKTEGVVAISPEKFQELQHAADLGYVPAKLRVAKLLLKNSLGIDPDPVRARKLIQEAVVICSEAEKNGCPHYQTDFGYAQAFQEVIPDENVPTKELLCQWSAIHSSPNSSSHINELKLSVLNHLLALRKDNPDRGFFQAMQLPASQQARREELIREAANQGGHIAIQRCLAHSFGHRDHWYYLYLAGKAELSWRGNTPESYFSKAYDEMKGNVYATGEEYVRNLALLAPYDERAGREYESLTTRLNFKLESSEPETLSGALESLNGRQVIKVLAKPSEKTRYLDITLGQEVRGFLTLDSSSREISNNHVRLEFSDSRGKSNQLLINSFTSMDTIPKKMKLVIGPRQQPLELKIVPNLSK